MAKANNPPESISRNPRLNWDKSSSAQQENFKSQLSDSLAQLDENIDCLQCDDVMCDHPDHRQGIDSVTRDILGKLTDAAWENLEATKGTTGDQASRAHTIPGWNDHVKPFHNEARFWHSLWSSAGKPIHSATPGVEHDLFKLMKNSRNQFHFAVRRTQNRLSKIQNDKIVSKLGTPELFEELQKSCKEKNSNVSSVIDDVHGARNISDHFKDIYEQLYNEQGGASDVFVEDINSKVANDAIEARDTIKLFTGDLVKSAAKKLKPNKSDVTSDFTSDCIKAVPNIFFDELALLFRTSLMHGYFSQVLLICALCPIVKDSNGDISSSKNYRGIAISSLILKIFDNCLLLLFGALLSNDVLQFGFQKKLSTVQCTWAVQETISHYLRSGSEVYCCLLDFSKAFDKVNFEQLFLKLIERKMPQVILRLFLFLYLHQTCFIS